MNTDSIGEIRRYPHHRARWMVPCLFAGLAPALAQGKRDAEVGAPYSPHELLHVEIRMDPDDWRNLRISHRSSDLEKITESTYEYYKADVVIDGKKFGSVGVRKKGFFGSVVSTRPSLKIRFDRYVAKQNLHGLDQLTLNNNVQDPSQLHQYMAYWFFGKAGAITPRCNFALVTVNGENLGVYSNVESIRKPFLRRVFKNSKGDLYEGYAGDFVQDESEFSRIVNKKGRPESGRKPLERLRDVLKESPVSLAAIEKLVAVDEFIRFWAVEVLIAHWDSYSGNRNNYYLFRDRATKRFHFIPWGADSVFWDPGPFIRQPVPKSVKALGILCRRLWEVPKIRQRYRREMQRLLREVFVEERVLAETRTIEKLLEPHITVDKALFRLRLEAARSFINKRRAEIEPELKRVDLKWPDVRVTIIRPAENPSIMEVTGSFSTTMTQTKPSGGSGAGKASITVSIDGEKQPAFEDFSAHAQLDDPEFIRPGYPVIRLVGKHPASKKSWNLRFYVDPIRLALQKRQMTVDHFCVWAMLIEGDPDSPTSGRRIFGISGNLVVDQLEQKIGGAVSGSFRIKVLAFEK